jgi:hypothetical protein
MSDWITWGNAWYLAGLILAGGATFVGVKYKKLVTELKEVFIALQEGYEDNSLTKKEKERIMKEILDVLGALLKIAWR